MLEAILQIILELVLDGFFELLAEAIDRRRPGRKDLHPALAAMLWAVIGAVLGAASLAVFPHLFIHDKTVQLLNLALTPLILGALMALLGRRRLMNGQEIVPLDKFLTAALFAFCMSGVRYLGAG